MKIAQQDLNNACARITLANKLAHAREAHRYQGEFRRSEKAVERDKRKNPYKANSEHAWCGMPPQSL